MYHESIWGSQSMTKAAYGESLQHKPNTTTTTKISHPCLGTLTPEKQKKPRQHEEAQRREAAVVTSQAGEQSIPR